MARRPRPKLVTLTDAAADRVKDIMDRQGAGHLRVGVKNGGCAGMEYTMDYVTSIEPLDEVVEDNGVSIVVDFEETALHAKFVFRNPNQTDACGCGESVTIVPQFAEQD